MLQTWFGRAYTVYTRRLSKHSRASRRSSSVQQKQRTIHLSTLYLQWEKMKDASQKETRHKRKPGIWPKVKQILIAKKWGVWRHNVMLFCHRISSRGMVDTCTNVTIRVFRTTIFLLPVIYNAPCFVKYFAHARSGIHVWCHFPCATFRLFSIPSVCNTLEIRYYIPCVRPMWRGLNLWVL